VKISKNLLNDVENQFGKLEAALLLNGNLLTTDNPPFLPQLASILIVKCFQQGCHPVRASVQPSSGVREGRRKCMIAFCKFRYMDKADLRG
jgi:hypothetical protein